MESSTTTSSLVPSWCVQHHPSRADLLARLRDRLPDFELVTDPEPDGTPSPLRTYLECLRRTPDDATHRIVIQDDAWPRKNFEPLARAALAEHNDELVAFFVPGIKSAGARRVRSAQAAGERWTDIGGTAITPVVALAWPAALIQPFLAFAENPRIAARYTHDDPVATLFVKSNKLRVWATVPSLVQHSDDTPSLIGRPHGNGKHRTRIAQWFVDES